MRALSYFLLLASVAASASAQPATRVVQMTNFKFTPSRLELAADMPVTLLLRNDASGGHSFTAREFFASARIDPASAKSVQSGRVEVPGHQTVMVTLIPRAGTYPLKCSHTLHSAFGMNGTIIVH